jgi:hypothetical protein
MPKARTAMRKDARFMTAKERKAEKLGKVRTACGAVW